MQCGDRHDRVVVFCGIGSKGLAGGQLVGGEQLATRSGSRRSHSAALTASALDWTTFGTPFHDMHRRGVPLVAPNDYSSAVATAGRAPGAGSETAGRLNRSLNVPA